MEDNLETYSGILLSAVIIPPSVYPLLFATCILLVMSALISASEVAFFSLKRQQIEQCANSGHIADRLILKLLANPRKLLATILILNNLVNVGIVTITAFITWEIAGQDNEFAALINTVVVTAAIVFFGELVPKVFANSRNLATARFTAYALDFSAFLLTPFSALLINLSSTIERRMEKKGYQVSPSELTKMVEITASKEEDREILKSIVNFGSKTVRQVMRSRIDITAVDLDEDFSTLIELIQTSSYSRIPVYEETIDRIKGVLYVKDLLPFIGAEKNFKWQRLIRTNTFFVPEHKRIDDLFSDFKKLRVHMAVVVDEYGGTSGLITLEDIIEEVVGEINDEFDENEIGYKKIDASTYTFEGKTSLNDFYKVLNISSELFSKVKGESESVSGLLLELFRKLPGPGEKIEHGNFVFTVVSADRKRIKSVRVLLKDKIVDLLPPPPNNSPVEEGKTK